MKISSRVQRTILCFVLALMLATSAMPFAFANGVEVPMKTISIADIGYNSINNAAGSKVLATYIVTPNDGNYGYNRISLSANWMYVTSNTNFAYVYLDIMTSNDGVNWTYIGGLSNIWQWNYGCTKQSKSGDWWFPAARQVQLVMRFTYTDPAFFTYGYAEIQSITNITLAQVGVAADQITAQNALNAANIAASAAQGAQTAANTAATNAQNAYNVANNAYNAANTAASQTIYNGQSAAYWAYQAAQGGADTTPPTIQKVQGLNGATCTNTGIFYVVVQATDNRAGQLQAHAQVDGGAWTGWYNIPASAIPVTLSSTGAHTITVEVKDAAGNIAQATMIAFRI